MKMRVADYIMTRIAEAGTDTVFMLAGGGMMHLMDALGRSDKLRFICNHNEQASAIAADAFGRFSGNIGACFATSGPGATNLLTGIVGAWQDSSPVLCLTGQVKTTQTINLSGIEGLRQFGTFEVDIVPIVRSVTKYAVLVTDPKTIRFHLEQALYLAKAGRPGPVLLDLPLDVQGATVDVDELVGFEPPQQEQPAVDSAQLAKVLEALRGARRPLIISGYGVRAAGAADMFREWVETLGIPVATSQLGKDVIEYEHPLFVGHPGPKGDRAGNFAVQTADVIVAIGSSLHSQTTGWENDLFARDAFKIQIDLDPAVLAREQVNVSLKLQVGIVDFLTAAMQAPSRPGRLDCAPWREQCEGWKKRYPVGNEPHVRLPDVANYYDFVDALSRATPPDACLVTDAGSGFYVMGQAFRIKRGQKFISSGSLGAMGFALSAAVGAAAGGAGLTVCVTGDGSLMTNVHDLATLRKTGLNVKLFVVNNQGYVSIRNTQKEFFGGLLVGTDERSGVYVPPLDRTAYSYDLPYLCCEQPADLDRVIAKAMATEGPVVVEIRAMFDQKIIPAVQSVRLPDGRMQSKPLQDMFPFLPEGVVEEEMARALGRVRCDA